MLTKKFFSIKKGVFLLCVLSVMCMLSGCVESRNLSEEDQDVIAEYSAGVLLQHYSKYNRRLEKSENPEPAAPDPAVPAPTPTPKEEPGGTESFVPGSEEADPEENVNEVSLNDLYNVPGLKVQYDSYVVCKSYPKNSAMQLTAKEGERLLVVRFHVKNTKSGPLKVNLIKRNIDYVMNLDGTEYKPTIAIQQNGGMNYLKTNLKPGATETAILLFEIPKASGNPGSLTMTVRDGDNVSVINCK